MLAEAFVLQKGFDVIRPQPLRATFTKTPFFYFTSVAVVRKGGGSEGRENGGALREGGKQNPGGKKKTHAHFESFHQK